MRSKNNSDTQPGPDLAVTSAHIPLTNRPRFPRKHKKKQGQGNPVADRRISGPFKIPIKTDPGCGCVRIEYFSQVGAAESLTRLCHPGAPTLRLLLGAPEGT